MTRTFDGLWRNASRRDERGAAPAAAAVPASMRRRVRGALWRMFDWFIEY
ncbi:MAG: hypothetical protein R3F20_10005 [Planctomycetota bacterium]